LTSAGAAAAIERRRWQPAVTCFLIALLLLPMAGRWSLRHTESEIAAARDIESQGVPVRLLQPNIANLATYDAVAVLQSYQKVIELSTANCEPGTLVVWPESAAWPYLYHEQGRRPPAGAGCARDDRPRLLGALQLGGKSGRFVLQLGLSRLSGGSVKRYDKRHLVPFASTCPFAVSSGSSTSWPARPASSGRRTRRCCSPGGRDKIGMAILLRDRLP